MNTILKYSCLLFFLLILGCRKDEITPINGENILTEVDNVSFLIQIIDEKNNGIPNAILTLKGVGQNFTSDANGFVHVNNITIPKTGIYTAVQAQFYHQQIKLLNGNENSLNIKYIKMVGDRDFNTISTGSEGFIAGNGKLKLPETLVREDGTNFQGNVMVKNNYFDPDAKDFLLSAPGNMLALNADNKFVTLASLGMYRIELFTEQGEPLKIKDGDKATLSFPIADVQEGFVSNTIPLWNLDETTGFWKQEGDAILNGDFVTAEVSHFSFWNIDLLTDFDEICITLKLPDGSAVPGVNVAFFVKDVFPFGYETTDNEGKICGRIPIDEAIKIEVHVSNVLIQSFEVGPFASGASDIELILTNKLVTVKGKAVSCDMNPITNGYGFAYAGTGGQLFQIFDLEEDGTFSYYTSNFDQKLTLVNIEDGKTITKALSATELESNVDLGIVPLCESSVEGAISGYVMFDNDEDGISDLPVMNHKVIINFNDAGISQDVFTDDNGYYSLTVPPGNYEILCYPILSGYHIIGSGDLSIDGILEGDAGEIIGKLAIQCIIEPNEMDEDNNYQFSPKGFGNIGGKVLIDLNNDGVGDKSAQGIQISYGKELTNSSGLFAYTDENGIYKSVNPVTNHIGEVEAIVGNNFNGVSDFDTSPDPDGDDAVLGPNFVIPIRLKKDEFDDDNNFTFAIDKSKIICRVLEDTNNDGIGDTGVSQQRVELYVRNSSGVPQGPLINGGSTTSDGYYTFHNVEPGEYVIYYIGSGDYIAVKGEDAIIDNNPPPSITYKQFLPVNIVDKEYDDGNTFIVKKN